MTILQYTPHEPFSRDHRLPSLLIHPAIEGQVSFSVRDPMNRPIWPPETSFFSISALAFRDVSPRRTPAPGS
jgi:hypothetical protein